MSLNENEKKLWRAIGLMTGTSMDGIDAAMIETDGLNTVRVLGAFSTRCPDDLRSRLTRLAQSARAGDTDHAELSSIADQLTDQHLHLVEHVLESIAVERADVDLIGFHGQTILHDPESAKTWQIGDGRRLADLSGIAVVNDFRSADMAKGGQGAPLAPIYHWARLRDGGVPGPVCILNLGGVGNLTWIDAGFNVETILAFDTGPGNALIDDWICAHTDQNRDENGRHAACGIVDDAVLQKLLDDEYFTRNPPKSLDRNAFAIEPVRSLSLQDGAATLTAFTADSVRLGLLRVPKMPSQIFVTGGGRHNATLMNMLRDRLTIPVEPVEALGWNGDSLEAEAFAYMAVRRLRQLPISFSGTTGVDSPTIGGVLIQPSDAVKRRSR